MSLYYNIVVKHFDHPTITIVLHSQNYVGYKIKTSAVLCVPFWPELLIDKAHNGIITGSDAQLRQFILVKG